MITSMFISPDEIHYSGDLVNFETFGQKLSSKIEIFVKKNVFLVKIPHCRQNRNFRQKTKFSSKNKIPKQSQKNLNKLKFKKYISK